MGFSNLEAIKRGFARLKEDPLTIAGITLVALIYWVVPFYITRFVLGVNQFLGAMLVLAILPVWFLVLMGYIKSMLDVHDGKIAGLADLFLHYDKLPDFLICFIFYLISVLVSMLFLVVPGIFLAVKFSFSLFFILQGELSAIKALKRSWKITGDNFFNLLIFYLILIIMNLFGFLFFLLGLVVTLPVTAIAVIFAYRKLSYDYNKKEISSLKVDNL